MAQLKSTSVTGNLSVTGNVVASKFIKLDGLNNQFLMADGHVENAQEFNQNFILKDTSILGVKQLQLYSENFNASDYDHIYVGNTNNFIKHRTRAEFIADLAISQVYNFKGALANINALKAITSAEVGDVYFISDTYHSWACKQKVTSATGNNYTTYWSDLGKNVDLSGYMTLDTNQTITGVKTFTNNLLLAENASSIITRSAAEEWTAGIYSNTIGDEVLGILVKNPKTHIMLGLGDAKARPAETDLTPAIDIQNNKVGINKRLGTDNSTDAGDYNLDVNGSVGINADLTLYTPEGTSPSLIFKRGKFEDNYNDWKIHNTGGVLKFLQTGEGTGSNQWVEMFTMSSSSPYSAILHKGVLQLTEHATFKYNSADKCIDVLFT